MKNETTFLKLLESYIETYLPVMKGTSKNTIISYKTTFRLLLEFMYESKGIPADKIAFSILDYDMLVDFFNWIEHDRKCSAATKNQRLSAMLSFSKYSQNKDVDAACVFRSALLQIPMKKVQHKIRSVFTREEVTFLLSIPNSRTAIGKRDRILLSVMYASGARAQELCDLTIRNIHFTEKGAVLDIIGKGEKARRVPISPSCALMLKNYISYRKISNEMERHVFSSQTHEKMSVSGIEALFKKYIAKARAEYPDYFRGDNYSPHTMRHSCASHMVEAGVPIVVIKNFLGHASIQTTEVYTRISQETIDKNLIEWNEKWHQVGKNEMESETESNAQMPHFLK